MSPKQAKSSKQHCLVIVESPTKIKSLNKFLHSDAARDFHILASYGHVRDLLPKEGAVDTKQGYAMHYQLIDRNQRHVAEICKAAKQADVIMLATDPDREGEAIAWHIYEILQQKNNLLKDKQVVRVVFNEITKRAIEQAVQAPRELSMDLVNAQQARRAMDFLVGFTLSPLLWKKISRGLSAGRVQSPALRLITEREEEIERFESREYWSFEAKCHHEGVDFIAKLTHYEGEKVKQFTVTDEATAKAWQQALEQVAKGHLSVKAVEQKDRMRQPASPFITSTLQQEAARKLGFSAKRTMRVAQQLYEDGLITYMRTDSVNLATEAITDIRKFIAKQYGADQYPKSPRVYQSKSKNAQEAHEAIRPTAIANQPSQLQSRLNDEQYKLYLLIWRRTVACQMIAATILQVAADFNAGDQHVFRANGSTIKDPGFLQVYEEGVDDQQRDKHLPMEQKLLPPLKVGEQVNARAIEPLQHFTEPPPRFTEASLIKALEEYGIGRPSTYASIIDTLQQREYVLLEKKRFTPTDMGRIVNAFLTDHFTQYVDYDFTAKLEDQLDQVAQGGADWIGVLDAFWQPFSELVVDKEKTVSREDVVQQRELGVDPKTGKPVFVRMGRFGPFVQLGHKDDEEKPKFAGLKSGQKMQEVDLATALDLLQLPKVLGQLPSGEEVAVGIGRYGPYIRYDKKFVSLREHDPYEVTFDEAVAVIKAHQEGQNNKTIKAFEAEGIQVLRGPYGPYITNGKKNARVPKGTDPESLTLEDCQAELAKPPGRRFGGGRRGAKGKAKSK